MSPKEQAKAQKEEQDKAIRKAKSQTRSGGRPKPPKFR